MIHRNAKLTFFWDHDDVMDFQLELRSVLEADTPVSKVLPEEEAQTEVFKRFLKFGKEGRRGKRIASVRNTEDDSLGLEVVTIVNLTPRRDFQYEDVVDRAMLEASDAGYHLTVRRVEV